MKRSRLIAIQEWFKKKSSKPWAAFETTGPNDEGMVEFSISWNKAFIENLQKRGYDGANEEDTVSMFFLSTRMIPGDMFEEDDTINPEATPRLTSEANILKR